MGAHVFVDGDQGTTGLGVVARLSARPGIRVHTLPQALRKDAAARAAAINDCDVAILCLPDEAARQAVASIRNPRVRVIDASSAHRVAAGWTYGLPELTPEQAQRIAEARWVSNPGCYPTGAIALLRPLVDAGCLHAAAPVTVYAVSGYSGRGREGVEAYENPAAAPAPAYQVYGLGLQHKHVPEIQRHAGLPQRPFFVPSYGRFRQGIVLTVPLHASMLTRAMSTRALRELYALRYRDHRGVDVLDDARTEGLAALDPEALNGSDGLRLAVLGNDAQGQFLLAAVYDNLGKGASGAAEQNLALMLGLPGAATGQGDAARGLAVAA